MSKYLKQILVSFFLIVSLASYSQVEMADNFRGEGKIYIVIGVILIILAGFFVLLFRLDNKTKKLEKEVKEK
ncbi:MAG: CcmD family protein [Ekhidna sp.]